MYFSKMLLQVFFMIFMCTFCSAQCYDSSSKYTCDAVGSLSQPKIVREQGQGPAADPVECHQICEQKFCKSLSYDADTQNCTTYTESVRIQGFQPDNSSSVRYWDKSCFGCLATCPEPIGTNLLGNPGFDQWNDSVLPWTLSRIQNSYPPVLVSPGYKSSQAYQLAGSIRQRFKTCPSATYLTTFYHQSHLTGNRRTKASAYLQIQASEVNAVLQPLHNITWTPLKFFLHTSSKQRKLQIGVTSYQEGLDTYVQVDEFKIEPIDIQPSSSPNIVTNGGFENGLSPWTLMNDTGPSGSPFCNVSDDGFESAHSLQCIWGDEPTSYGPRIQQQITTSQDTAYVLSFDYKVIYGSGDITCNHCGISYSWGVFEYPGIPGGASVNNNNTWLHFESSVYANHPTTTLNFAVSGEGAGANCTFNIDNISLVAAQ